jgi:hypothetical protein
MTTALFAARKKHAPNSAPTQTVSNLKPVLGLQQRLRDRCNPLYRPVSAVILPDLTAASSSW